jgi:hypothetical protein
MRRSGPGRVLGPILVLAVTVVGVVYMADATQYRGDPGRTGATRVVFRVETKNYRHDLDEAATALWAPCAGAVGWTEVAEPLRAGGNTYVAEIRPSLGEHSSRRLRGCLEDAAIDKVRGAVIEWRSTG